MIDQMDLLCADVDYRYKSLMEGETIRHEYEASLGDARRVQTQQSATDMQSLPDADDKMRSVKGG